MKKNTLSYYSREAKSVLGLIVFLPILWLLVSNKSLIIQTIFSEKGMMVLLGLAIAGVSATVIRIYYRVMIMKYHERQ